MTILVCNAGSSSLKFSLFEEQSERLLAEGGVDWGNRRLVIRRPDGEGGGGEWSEELPQRDFGEAVARIFEVLREGAAQRGEGEVEAVGHRVVHGGARFTGAVRITAEVQRAIGELAELAPLHNPLSLEVIQAVERVLPRVPQVAAFDTAFHATLPEAARTYAVPEKWRREWGLRRYGFHGLSVAYCARRAAEMIGLGRNDLRLIVAHLGNGASVSAVRGGVGIDTSMGFTPLEGLVMGTRSGSVDPGMLVYLLREKGLTGEELDRVLNHKSGLLGLSGRSGDMRELLAAGDANARLAVEVYVHRLRQMIGAMAATLGGVDGLVFTAGVGEHSAEIRWQVCENLEFLGLRLDRAANDACKPDGDISRGDSAGRILVIATREDLTIVRATRELIFTAGERRF